MTTRAEQAALEGFLDVIKRVYADANRAKKSDPDSWKRSWLSTQGLIKNLQKTYCDANWINHRGLMDAPTITMVDQASYLVLNDEIPTDPAQAVLDHLHQVKYVLDRWRAAGLNHCDIIRNTLQNIRFNPNRIDEWPYYSNKLSQMLRNMKPLNLLDACHDFTAILGTPVVLPDGHLSIGTHHSRHQRFSTLTAEQIVQLADAIIAVLQYKAPSMPYAPRSLYTKIEIQIGIRQELTNNPHNPRETYTVPVYKTMSFMQYLYEHNETLAHLIFADYHSDDIFIEDDEEHDDAMYFSQGDYRNSLQPFNELTATLSRVALAAEYWLYRSVK